MANDKKVKASTSNMQQVDFKKFDIPAGDSSFTVELDAPVPAGKKAVVRGHLTISIEDA